MQDRRLQRVDRQLASVISVTTAAANEAESLNDQALADDLHKVLVELKKIHAGIGERGQRYRRL